MGLKVRTDKRGQRHPSIFLTVASKSKSAPPRHTGLVMPSNRTAISFPSHGRFPPHNSSMFFEYGVPEHLVFRIAGRSPSLPFPLSSTPFQRLIPADRVQDLVVKAKVKGGLTSPGLRCKSTPFSPERPSPPLPPFPYVIKLPPGWTSRIPMERYVSPPALPLVALPAPSSRLHPL